MSALEEFILKYEAEEAAVEMHFSLYSIPTYYQTEEPS